MRYSTDISDIDENLMGGTLDGEKNDARAPKLRER